MGAKYMWEEHRTGGKRALPPPEHSWCVDSPKTMKAGCGSFLIRLRKYFCPSHTANREWTQGHSCNTQVHTNPLIQVGRSTYTERRATRKENSTSILPIPPEASETQWQKNRTNKRKTPHLWSQGINKLIFMERKRETEQLLAGSVFYSRERLQVLKDEKEKQTSMELRTEADKIINLWRQKINQHWISRTKTRQMPALRSNLALLWVMHAVTTK